MSEADAERGVGYRVDGHTAWITLRRPSVLNAIDYATDVELAECWKRADDDPGVWAIVLSGEGRAFCAGADLGGTPHGDREPIAFGGGLTGVGGPLVTLSTPLIAAVAGYALGGGFELAASADIIVAADDVVFGIPETTIGVIQDSGVLHRAVRQLPPRVALGMILAGRRLGGDEALRLGFINELVPAGDLLPAAERWADQICAASPGANRAAKAAVHAGAGVPLEIALSTRYPSIDEYADTADAAEAIAAFSERRRPNWSGARG